MSRRLVVVCDVGPSYGIGHLMRCLALAEEFASRSYDVTLLADVPSVPFALAQVEARGFEHAPAPDDPGAVLEVVRELAPDLVLLDSYHRPVRLYRDLREVAPTIAMVDGDPRGKVGTVVLDQNIGAEGDSWDYGDSDRVLAGLDYALMRADILDRRPSSPERAEAEPLRLFAFFGGTDAFGVGPRVTRALIETGEHFALTVVAPTGWTLGSERLEPRAGQAVGVIGPTDRLAEHVVDADLVVSAAGTSSWELLCLGAAVGLVCVADNQELAYGRAIESGLAAGVGTPEQLDVGVLASLLTDAERRAELRRRGWESVDGRGRARVATSVEDFLA